MSFSEKIKNEFGEHIQYEKEFQNYLNILEILSTSCINNKYCILSCRKLLSIEKLLFMLKSNNYPYKLKSILLLFLKNAYYPFPSINDIKIDIQYFFDIIENFVIKELIAFYFYRDFFIERNLIRNDEFNQKEQINNDTYNLIFNKLKKEPEIKEYLNHQKIILDYSPDNINSLFYNNKFISKNKIEEEYMNFFVSNSKFKNEKMKGLISFIYQMHIYIKENQIELNQQQKRILLLIKTILNKILDFLGKIEKEEIIDDNYLINIEYNIQKCLSVLIYEDNDILYYKQKNIKNQIIVSENENQKIEQNAQKLLENVKNYILLNETSILKIFNLSENDNIIEIKNIKFIRAIKLLFKNKINNEEINDTIKYLDKTDKGKINLKDLYIYFNKNKKNKGDKKDQIISEYLDINSKLDDKSFKISFTFKEYLFIFYKIHKQIGYNNSLKNIISLLISENNTNNLILFFSRILRYIIKNENNKKQKLYFIQFIHGILNDKNYYSIEKNNQIKTEKIEVIQLILCHSGVIEFILKNLCLDSGIEIIYECFSILNLCLKKENRNVQNTIYNYASFRNNTYKFLACLKEILVLSIKFFKEKNKNFINNNLIFENLTNNDDEMGQYLNQDLKLSEMNILKNISSDKISDIILSKNMSFYYKLPKFTLLFIQLCCKNNENFQHFFRDSEYDINYINENNNRIECNEKGNINLIYDMGTLLVSLLNFGSLIYSDYEIWYLTKEIFTTLSYFCEGPCEENQLVLGLRKIIFNSFNIILKRDYNFKIKDEINIRKNLLLCFGVSFLKSLLSEKSLLIIGEILLDNLDIYLLIEKLIDIYSFIIKPNEELLYNGEICEHIQNLNNIKSLDNIKKDNKFMNINECEERQCKINYISKNEMEFINTGFNIFIILTYLKEKFPNHQKLSLFEINMEKRNYIQFLKINQIKKTNKNETRREAYFNINKNEFHNSFKNDFILNMNEITEINKKLFNNSYENDNETRKTIDNTEFNFSDMNLQEISILEESICSRIFKCITCGIFNKNKKFINKKNRSFEIKKIYSNSMNNFSLYNSFQKNNDVNDFKNRFILKYKSIFIDSYIFYAKHTSSVEISIKNSTIKKYFKIPFIFIYLTDEIKLKIIKECYSKSNLLGILHKIQNLIQILNSNQKLRKYHLLFENIRPIEIISYIFSIAFNLILLIFIKNDDFENCSNWQRTSCIFINQSENKEKYKYRYNVIYYIINGLILTKIVLYFITFVLTIIKEYKLIKNNMNNKAELLIEEYKNNKMEKYEGTLLYYLLDKFNKSSINAYKYIIISLYKSKGFNIIFDFDIFFIMIDILFSFLSLFISPFFLIFSLFDIIKLNSFLRHLFIILIRQTSKFFYIIYILLIVVFIFSVIEFLFMREYYYSNDYKNISDNEINLYCDTIYYCFISILHYGINPNNIILIGSDISRKNNIFFVKLVIDVFLFCIVFSFSSSLFLSIIINSLKEFKEIIKEKKDAFQERCFICGLSSHKLDRREKGWIYHYKKEHNIFSYIYFLFEIKNKNNNE